MKDRELALNDDSGPVSVLCLHSSTPKIRTLADMDRQATHAMNRTATGSATNSLSAASTA